MLRGRLQGCGSLSWVWWGPVNDCGRNAVSEPGARLPCDAAGWAWPSLPGIPGDPWPAGAGCPAWSGLEHPSRGGFSSNPGPSALQVERGARRCCLRLIRGCAWVLEVMELLAMLRVPWACPVLWRGGGRCLLRIVETRRPSRAVCLADLTASLLACFCLLLHN